MARSLSLDELCGGRHFDRAPPPGRVPHIADGTLVSSDAVHFPSIPANAYAGVTRPAVRFLGVNNPLHVLDRGAGYRAGDISGVTTIEPPRVGTVRYGALVPQVDLDGNDIAGVRATGLPVWSQGTAAPPSATGLIFEGWQQPVGETGWRGWVPWPRFSAANITVGNPDWAKQPHFATLDEIDFQVKVLPLKLVSPA